MCKDLRSKEVQPSIIYNFSSQGLQGGWRLSQLASVERRGTLWTGHQSITDLTRRDEQPFTLTGTTNSESTISVKRMCSDYGRKLEGSPRENTQRLWENMMGPNWSSPHCFTAESCLCKNKCLKKFFKKEIYNSIYV